MYIQHTQMCTLFHIPTHLDAPRCTLSYPTPLDVHPTTHPHPPTHPYTPSAHSFTGDPPNMEEQPHVQTSRLPMDKMEDEPKVR